MPLVIAVSSLKGGVGKTTIALNLGVSLHLAGHRTLLVDADKQRSLRRWAERGEALGVELPPVVGLDGARLRKDLAQISAGFAAVVIDCPPQLGAESRAAMLAADLVLIPTCPGAVDTWALEDTLQVLEDARGLRPEIVARLLLNRAERTALTKATTAAIGGASVAMLDTVLGARVAFGEATSAGQSVVTYAETSEAAREVRRLGKEVLAVLS